MDRIDVTTVVYRPREEIYDFLVDFPRYTRYTKHLREVTQYGDGDPGTEYDLHFAWWKIGYTLRSKVVGTDPPDRIDWEVVEDIDASGAWVLESAPEAVPEDRDAETATRIHLRAAFDPDTADEDAVSLPPLVSLDWVIDKVEPLVTKEAERVVARAVRDLEGRPRDVEIAINERPDL